jgi:hypothetical protein
MSTSINAMVSGVFETGATLKPVNISLPTGFDYIEITNLDDVGSSGSGAKIFAQSIMGAPNGYARIGTNAGGALGYTNSVIIADGFTTVTASASTPPTAPIAIAGISQAATAVLTTASTPVTVGDIVRIYGTTDMLQVSSLDFTVGTVVAGVSFELDYLDSSAFASAATAGFWMRIPFDSAIYPRVRYITGITQAAQAVVTLSVTHGYAVGEKVQMVVPVAFGMSQMNGLTGTIVAINTATNTITLDINSSGFTAFAYPTSAVAATGVVFPQVVPFGDAATAPYGFLFDDAKNNSNFSGIQIGTGCLVASKHYSYIARRGLPV